MIYYALVSTDGYSDCFVGHFNSAQDGYKCLVDNIWNYNRNEFKIFISSEDSKDVVLVNMELSRDEKP